MTEHRPDPFAPPLDLESRVRLAAALTSAESNGDEDRQPDVDAASQIEAALDVAASDEAALNEAALTEAALEEAALKEDASEDSALSEAAIRRIMRTTRRLIAESSAHDAHAAHDRHATHDEHAAAATGVDHDVNDTASRVSKVAAGARASRATAAAPRIGGGNRTPWSPYSLVAAALLVLVGLYVAFSGDGARRGGGRGASRSDVASVARLPLRPARFGASDRELAPPLLAIGDTLSTGPREKRRVTLPDGTVVALNAQTKMTVAANRRVQLERGELYVEAAPADSASTQTKAQMKPQTPTPNPASTPARFIVETPRRSVTALGTKFLVAASDEETQVVVTQGQVRVSGVDTPIEAGKEATVDKYDRVRIAVAKRSSYVVDWVKDLLAATSTLVPASAHSGGSITVLDSGGQEMKLSLRNFHVDVHIEDGFARTTIDQTYFNHTWQQLEGTFRFPLPADASLSRLAMYVNGRLMEGGMVERDHGRNVFETIRHTRRDPALLEWVDGSTFQMRVFPLEARQEKRIILCYTQRLPSDYGKSTYRFPSGHNLEGVRRWSTSVRLKDGADRKWNSPSHVLESSNDGRDLLLTGSEEHSLLDRDLIVEFPDSSAPKGDGPKGAAPQGAAPPNDANRSKSADTRWSQFEQDGYRYVMLRHRPTVKDAPARAPRHWIFLYENSGDRNEITSAAQWQIAKTLLENVEHDDTFSVIRASTEAALFRKKPLDCSLRNVANALKFLEEERPLGALDLSRALELARSQAKSKHETWLVHLGTGVPVLGERDEATLVRRLPERTKYLGIAVGKRWSKAFMESAAGRTGGAVVQINPDEALEWRAFELLSELNAPRLTDIRVDAPDTTFLALTKSIADGQELAAVARLPLDRASPSKVTIRAKLIGRDYSFELAAPPTLVKPEPTSVELNGWTIAGHLPRTWAKLEIDRLTSLGAQENRAEITTLSKAMYVMSPFTSLLVLETEAMYEQFKVDRGRKDHWAPYPAPETLPPSDAAPNAAQQPPTPLAAARDRLKLIQARVQAAKKQHERAVADHRPASEIARLQRALTAETSDEKRVANEIARLEKEESNANDPLVKAWRSVVFRDPTTVGAVNQANVGRRWREATWDGNGWTRNEVRFRSRGRLGRVRTDNSIDGEDDFIDLYIRDGRSERFIDELPTLTDSLRPNITRGIRLPVADKFNVYGNRGYYFAPTLDDQRDSSGRFGDNFVGRGVAEVDDFETDFREQVVGQRLAGLYARNSLEPRFRRFGGEPGYFEFVPPNSWHFNGNESDWGRHGQLKGVAQVRLLNDFDEVVDLDFTRPNMFRTPNSWIVAPDMNGDWSGVQELQELNVSAKHAGRRLVVGAWDRVEDGGQLFGTNGWARRRAGQEVLEGELPVLLARDATGTFLGRDETRTFFLGRDGTLMRRAAAGTLGQDAPATYLIRNLVDYASALQSWPADREAVVERQAVATKPLVRGRVDDGARQLIEKARAIGWRQYRSLDRHGRPVGDVVQADGQGRFAARHETIDRLVEQVYSDGRTLLHLYPDLGLGAVRELSRFHGPVIQCFVPHFVPPVDELNIATDVTLAAPRTIRLTAHSSNSVVELEFAESGELREVRVLALAGKKEGEADKKPVETTLVTRMTLGEDGTVRTYDGRAKLLGEQKFEVRPCDAPNLTPDQRDFVVLPLPYRSLDSLALTVPLDLQSNSADYSKLSEADALRLVGSYFAANNEPQLSALVDQRFVKQGDRRVGFAVLLSCLRRQHPLVMNAATHYPDAPIAKYLQEAEVSIWIWQQNQNAVLDGGPRATPFVNQLCQIYNQIAQWSGDRPLGAGWTDESTAAKLRETLTQVHELRDPGLARFILDWVYASLKRNQLLKPASAKQLVEAIEAIEHDRGWEHFGGELHVVSLLAVGDEASIARAQTQLVAQLQAAFAMTGENFAVGIGADLSPAVRAAFVAATTGKETDSCRTFAEALRTAATKTNAEIVRSESGNGNGNERTASDARERLSRLARRLALLDLAIQASLQNEKSVAAEIATLAIGDQDLAAMPTLNLAVCRYAQVAEDWKLADACLRRELATERGAKQSALWRDAAHVSLMLDDVPGWAVRMARAIEIDTSKGGSTIDAAVLRVDFANVLGQLEMSWERVTEHRRPGKDELRQLLDLVAQRWREFDPDEAASCYRLAESYAKLGEARLAWIYRTTPLSAAPDQSATWAQFAGVAQRQGRVVEASRAWSIACETEPTNPDHLMSHADFWLSQNQLARARVLWQKVADGEWQPRFAPTKERAKQLLK